MRRGRHAWHAGALAALYGAAAAVPMWGQAVAAFEVRDGGIHAPLTATPGDAARGGRIAADPALGNCLICHRVPDAPHEPFQGDVGPPLAGVGARVPAARLRLRIVDGTRINRDTAMPAYHRVRGLQRVAAQWQGKPVLDAQQVEDVLAWLLTLDEEAP